jgi:Tfp pilus assembly protein PilF
MIIHRLIFQDVSALHNYGILLAERGRLDRAADLFNKALKV